LSVFFASLFNKLLGLRTWEETAPIQVFLYQTAACFAFVPVTVTIHSVKCEKGEAAEVLEIRSVLNALSEI
jgi:hypothetical protein